MKHYSALFALLICALFAFPAIAQEEPLNQTDPVMEGEPVDPEIYTDYEGIRVWFSSESSKQLFEFAPEDYAANVPQLSGEVDSGSEEDFAPEPNWIEPRDTITEAESQKAATTFTERLRRLAANSHVALVHLPIGLLLAAALGELLALKWRRLDVATLFTLAAGAAGAAVSVATGLLLEERVNYQDAMHDVLELHETLGIVTLISAALCLVAWWGNHRLGDDRLVWLRRVMVWGTALLVGVTGHFGGTLVYGFGWLAL